jgi:UDP-GlcNAc:undecaprenyl-phosphate GlcNAc-1-phosphate transferase
MIISFFYITEKTELKIKRSGPISTSISRMIHSIKEKRFVIKIAFKLVEYGFPLLLIVSSILAISIPQSSAIACVVWVGLTVYLLQYKKEKSGVIVNSTLFVLVPTAVYYSQFACDKFTLIQTNIYHLSFLALFMCVILTLKFTSRRKGFKSSILDYMLFFIALILPLYMARFETIEYTFQLTAKILFLLFGFRVLLGEKRGDAKSIGYYMAAAIVMLALKGLFF